MQGPIQVRNAIEPFVEPLAGARAHPGWTWAAEAVLVFAAVGLWADLARLEWIACLPGPFDAGIQWWTYTLTLFVGLAMIETMAIYALVVALLVLFANPFAK